MFNADDFCNHLNNEINSFFLTISYIDGNNFDAIFDHFLQLLTNTITLYAPMRKLTRKQQKLINKPWISRGILKSIKTKQKLYLSHFVNGNLEQKQLYKKYANKLTKVKFAAKKPVSAQSFFTCSYLESNLYLCCVSLQGYFFTTILIFTFMRCCEQQEISACCVAKLHLICILFDHSLFTLLRFLVFADGNLQRKKRLTRHLVFNFIPNFQAYCQHTAILVF